jgi:hypothetical protein
MNWQSLLWVGVGVLLGYGFFLGQSARRRLRSSEDEAMEMYAASLRSLAQRMDQLAQITADRPAESEDEKTFMMGQAAAFGTVAQELAAMADKVA